MTCKCNQMNVRSYWYPSADQSGNPTGIHSRGSSSFTPCSGLLSGRWKIWQILDEHQAAACGLSRWRQCRAWALEELTGPCYRKSVKALSRIHWRAKHLYGQAFDSQMPSSPTALRKSLAAIPNLVRMPGRPSASRSIYTPISS